MAIEQQCSKQTVLATSWKRRWHHGEYGAESCASSTRSQPDTRYNTCYQCKPVGYHHQSAWRVCFCSNRTRTQGYLPCYCTCCKLFETPEATWWQRSCCYHALWSIYRIGLFPHNCQNEGMCGKKCCRPRTHGNHTNISFGKVRICCTSTGFSKLYPLNSKL